MSSGTTYRLNGVWGSSSSDVFAVGDGGTILHYNGDSWSSMASGTTHRLYDVWSSSSSDVFAVGDGGIILHYNGTAWSSMSSGTTYHLHDVWGGSASDVFAVGDYGTILHYNGDSWSSVGSGTTYHLNGVCRSSAFDVFVIGDCGTILHATRPAPAQAGTYSFSIDVGSMHFAGEKAEFYVLSTYNGTPADATIALVNLYGPGGTLTADLTGAVTSVTTGLFRIPYDIPAAAPTGTYTLLIETKYCYDAYWGLWIHMAEIKSFRVSSTSTQWNPPMTPATFSVSDLSIQPAEVQAEETVTITASVANVGGAEGTCTVVLNINGVKEAEQAVSLGAGESQDVTFSVSREEAATYSVAVEGLTGEFVVVPPPPANYGPLYSGIVAGVIAVGLLSYYWMTRRRAY